MLYKIYFDASTGREQVGIPQWFAQSGVAQNEPKKTGIYPICSTPFQGLLMERGFQKPGKDQMVDLDSTRTSQTEWSFPVAFVLKKHGTIRFCVDCLSVHLMTNHQELLPDMDSRVGMYSLGEAMILSTFANRGFWHVELGQDDCNKTVFMANHSLPALVAFLLDWCCPKGASRIHGRHTCKTQVAACLWKLIPQMNAFVDSRAIRWPC